MLRLCGGPSVTLRDKWRCEAPMTELVHYELAGTAEDLRFSLARQAPFVGQGKEGRS